MEHGFTVPSEANMDIRDSIIEWIDWIIRIGRMEDVKIIARNNQELYDGQISKLNLGDLSEIASSYSPEVVRCTDGKIVIVCEYRL